MPHRAASDITPAITLRIRAASCAYAMSMSHERCADAYMMPMPLLLMRYADTDDSCHDDDADIAAITDGG